MKARHKHPLPSETGPFFSVMQDSPAHLAFEAEWMRVGTKSSKLMQAHSDFRCSQCLFSTAAEWFYLGWKAAGK